MVVSCVISTSLGRQMLTWCYWSLAITTRTPLACHCMSMQTLTGIQTTCVLVSAMSVSSDFLSSANAFSHAWGTSGTTPKHERIEADASGVSVAMEAVRRVLKRRRKPGSASLKSTRLLRAYGGYRIVKANVGRSCRSCLCVFLTSAAVWQALPYTSQDMLGVSCCGFV